MLSACEITEMDHEAGVVVLFVCSTPLAIS
jgi:hypothetical protein